MQPDCKSAAVSNMWFGLMSFKNAGEKIPGHKHNFDHCTLLASGKFRVIKYGEDERIEYDEILTSPCIIFIDKDRIHSVEALTDNAVACCCHAIYEKEKDLFPIDASKVPIVGGQLLVPLASDIKI